MQRTRLDHMECPIARALDRVGEWWSMLILRDAMHGLKRFDEFQKSLGIAPNILARRLEALVDAGMLERHRYSEHPPRFDYVPTERGWDFGPVLAALVTWGNRHFAPDGEAVILAHTATGRRVEPMIVDRLTGQELAPRDVALAAGPRASERVKQKYQLGQVAAARRRARSKRAAH